MPATKTTTKDNNTRQKKINERQRKTKYLNRTTIKYNTRMNRNNGTGGLWYLLSPQRSMLLHPADPMACCRSLVLLGGYCASSGHRLIVGLTKSLWYQTRDGRDSPTKKYQVVTVRYTTVQQFFFTLYLVWQEEKISWKSNYMYMKPSFNKGESIAVFSSDWGHGCIKWFLVYSLYHARSIWRHFPPWTIDYLVEKYAGNYSTKIRHLP